jgi:hypothetical protein
VQTETQFMLGRRLSLLFPDQDLVEGGLWQMTIGTGSQKQRYKVITVGRKLK